jgi:NTP pyrophosphatase (non-canonical NTP hydrolase)
MELTLPETPEILVKAIDEYGIYAQSLKCVEELNELAVELMHSLRVKETSYELIDEIADVLIMAMSMRHCYGLKDVDERIQFKLHRLKERMK